MAEQLVPTVTIQLDKPRKARLDFNAMIDFERVTGESLMRATDLFQSCPVACPTDCATAHEHEAGCQIEHQHKTMNMNALRAFMWACLVQEDESLTERDVGRMLGISNIAVVTETMAKLFSETMPEQEAGTVSGAPLSVTKKNGSTG